MEGYVTGTGAHGRGDRRRRVLVLAILVLQLAEGHLTATLFRQIIRRIERLARHPT
jgi:hypothetical protein